LFCEREVTLFFKRKKTETPPFDEAKFQYERVIKRCYASESVALALCSFKHFTGFNWEHGVLERRRADLVNDSFEIAGVIHAAQAAMYALRVFSLRIDAPKNSSTRVRAFGLAAARMAGIAKSVVTIARALAMQPRPLPPLRRIRHRCNITRTRWTEISP
jgi:hypothetical protein